MRREVPVLVAAVLLAGLTSACSGGTADAGGPTPRPSASSKSADKAPTGKGSLEISSADFKKWPFTVDKGRLACKPGKSVTFTANGTEYAVNGTAKSQGYKPIDPVWAQDKELGHGLKVNIGDVLNRGLELC
jgi:hypothetical protein